MVVNHRLYGVITKLDSTRYVVFVTVRRVKLFWYFIIHLIRLCMIDDFEFFVKGKVLLSTSLVRGLASFTTAVTVAAAVAVTPEPIISLQ